MKIRQQVAKPCEKKGQDNYLLSNACECMATCDQLKGFLKSDSLGTNNYKKSEISSFSGCLNLEVDLINENLIRYESREVGGLEVLFEGIESIQNLNAEIFNFEFLDGIDLQSPAGIANFYADSIGNYLVDSVDNDKGISKGNFTDEGLVNYFPEALGYSQTSAHAFAALAPENLQDSFFQSMYSRGAFDNESEDIQNLVTCMFHRIDDPREIKKIWPRFTEARYQRHKAIIWTKVHNKMPWWAKRFNKFWDRLSEAQAEALVLEWFYDGEKPSQAENSEKLGISISSYQERLDWSYKKLIELYPELRRIKRKAPATSETPLPGPLYDVLPNGDRVLMAFPLKKEKNLSPCQKIRIRNWAKQSTTDFLSPQDIGII